MTRESVNTLLHSVRARDAALRREVEDAIHKREQLYAIDERVAAAEHDASTNIEEARSLWNQVGALEADLRDEAAEVGRLAHETLDICGEVTRLAHELEILVGECTGEIASAEAATHSAVECREAADRAASDAQAHAEHAQRLRLESDSALKNDDYLE